MPEWFDFFCSSSSKTIKMTQARFYPLPYLSVLTIIFSAMTKAMQEAERILKKTFYFDSIGKF